MCQKIFIIGLDGATLDLLIPWLEQGYLPHIGRLVDRGVVGPLMSTFPPLTGPAWSSFMTGMSPGRHGIFEFFRRQEGSYKQELNNRTHIAGQSLWRLLSDGGCQVGIMGIPLTYPPEAIDGFIITGLLTPPNRRDFTYPKELLQELENELGAYRLRHDEKYRKADPYPFIKEQNEILENNTKAALYLLQNKPWDVFMVHILGTDRMQHEFWHTLDLSHPSHDPVEVERLGDVILDFFRKTDEAIGRLLETLDESTPVIVMSDHGFGPVYKFVNFNTWLLDQGLLVLKNTLGTRLRHLMFKIGFNYTVLGNLILKLGLGKKAIQVGRAGREVWQRRVFLSLNDVDWSRSRMYSIGNFGQLFVNLRGREPEGIVEEGEEYEELLEEVEGRLRKLADPETSEPIIERIFRRSEVYTGPFAESGPDLLFFTRNMEYKAMGLSDFSSNQVFEIVFGTTGHHRMNGLLICYGPGIFKEGDRSHEANIQDLAPTILYLMGLKIPKDMDGRVLLEVFTPEFCKQRLVEYEDASNSQLKDPRTGLTDDEEAHLTEILRSLGYVT